MEADLRARLLADTGIMALVQRKAIANGDRPQASGLPAITFDVVAGERSQHMSDFQRLQSNVVQVDVWSDDKLLGSNIRELVIAALAPPVTQGATRFGRAFVQATQASFELTDSAMIYRERIDFTIWHAPAV